MSYETINSELSVLNERVQAAHRGAPDRQERQQAVRCLAQRARDADELAEWLRMLGLSAEEGMVQQPTR